jgi:hypothetical protein
LKPVREYLAGKVGLSEDKMGGVDVERGRKKKRRGCLLMREGVFGRERSDNGDEVAVEDGEEEFVRVEEA